VTETIQFRLVANVDKDDVLAFGFSAYGEPHYARVVADAVCRGHYCRNLVHTASRRTLEWLPMRSVVCITVATCSYGEPQDADFCVAWTNHHGRHFFQVNYTVSQKTRHYRPTPIRNFIKC